jgi:hypothetical protein
VSPGDGFGAPGRRQTGRGHTYCNKDNKCWPSRFTRRASRPFSSLSANLLVVKKKIDDKEFLTNITL